MAESFDAVVKFCLRLMAEHFASSRLTWTADALRGTLTCVTSDYSFIRSFLLHGSETWPVRKENVVALQRAEMRMVRWMCGVKLKDRLPSKELREIVGVDDIALVL